MGERKSANAKINLESLLMLIGRRLILFSTPVLLAIIFSFHAAAGDDVYDTLSSSTDTWLTVHILLLPVFGLLGIALYLLLADYDGLIATIGRIGISVYLIFYIAFESIAGIATGVIVREGQQLSAEQQEVVAEIVQTFYSDGGIVGAFALAGTAGYFVAVIAIAIVLRRSGAPVAPLVLLVISTNAIIAHGSFPSDAFGALSFLVAVGWLEFAWTRTEMSEATQRTVD